MAAYRRRTSSSVASTGSGSTSNPIDAIAMKLRAYPAPTSSQAVNQTHGSLESVRKDGIKRVCHARKPSLTTPRTVARPPTT
jgi:hypothetical protein